MLNLTHFKSAKKLSWLAMMLIVAACLFTARGTATDQIVIYAEPPSVTPGVGVEFNVTIKADNIPASPGAVGFEVGMTWNATVLEAISMTEVLYHSIVPEEEWDNIWRIQHIVNKAAGQAKYTYTFQDSGQAFDGGYAPISGNHTLAILTFRGASAGISSLCFPLIKIGDRDSHSLPAVGICGTVTVGNPPPTVTVVSPRNITYVSSSISITPSFSEEATWMAYSLDGAANVTFTGSANITVSDGLHDIVVYANDTTGQTGASEKVSFTVVANAPPFLHDPPTPQPVLVLGNYRWSFTFNASQSYDPALGITDFFWDFGDGSNATGIAAQHQYREAGTYTVTLTVTDEAGNVATNTETLNISPAEAPLDLPLGMIFAIVVPATWVACLWYYIRRAKSRKKIN